MLQMLKYLYACGRSHDNVYQPTLSTHTHARTHACAHRVSSYHRTPRWSRDHTERLAPGPIRTRPLTHAHINMSKTSYFLSAVGNLSDLGNTDVMGSGQKHKFLDKPFVRTYRML